MSNRHVIRGYIDGVRRDDHWRGKASLLPPRSGFARKRNCGEQSACRAPKVADVSPCVGRTLVKANSGDGAADVRLERNSQFQRTAGAIINRGRHRRAWPDRLLSCRVAAACQDNCEAQ